MTGGLEVRCSIHLSYARLKLAGTAGFEPATNGLTVRRSTN